MIIGWARSREDVIRAHTACHPRQEIPEPLR